MSLNEDLPVKITFHGVDHSEAVETRIRERAARLAKFAPRATGLDVTVSAPHHHSRKGKLFQFTLDLHVPKGDIVVRQADTTNHAHEDVYVALRDAFEALERQAREHNEKQGH